MPILHWLTREQDIRATQAVPYRLLEDVFDLGAGEKDTGNMLIQGDNLEALKALLPFYAGRVKCIYIDPPYNTRSAFEHYDDNLEHTQWLAMMWPRLELLRDLLAEEGSIWVSVDDAEGHYMKVVMDEVFGRNSFVVTNVWQKRYSRENREAIGDVHEYMCGRPLYCKENLLDCHLGRVRSCVDGPCIARKIYLIAISVGCAHVWTAPVLQGKFT
jgi:adenine-specific DNA-methyltransferase